MKRHIFFVFGLFFVIHTFLPAFSAGAASQNVAVTYSGDTQETIMRRAKWIEAAKQEKELNWWGTMRPNMARDLLAEFNKVYPFINVIYWRGRGEEIAAKVEAEFAAGRRSVDITLGGEPYNYPRWRKMGILEKYTDIVPGINKIPQKMYSKHGDWLTAGNNAITPQYNTNLVSAAEAPKNWEDLLDPKWKGKIGLTRDMKVWTTLALGEGGWGVEKTEKFLRGLGNQDPIWTAGHTAGHTLLIAGEFDIMAEDYAYHTLKSQDMGAPVEWVRVNPAVITGSSFTLQRLAPHPNAARLFLEWQTSPQGLALYEKITSKGAAFPGSGTRISKALDGLDLVFRTEDVILEVIERGLVERFYDLAGISN